MFGGIVETNGVFIKQNLVLLLNQRFMLSEVGYSAKVEKKIMLRKKGKRKLWFCLVIIILLLSNKRLTRPTSEWNFLEVLIYKGERKNAVTGEEQSLLSCPTLSILSHCVLEKELVLLSLLFDYFTLKESFQSKNTSQDGKNAPLFLRLFNALESPHFEQNVAIV